MGFLGWIKVVKSWFGYNKILKTKRDYAKQIPKETQPTLNILQLFFEIRALNRFFNATGLLSLLICSGLIGESKASKRVGVPFLM